MTQFNTVYIAGCWDFLHEGHLNILKKAKEFGDFLVVAVNSDAFINDYKGITTHQNETTRLNNIRELEFVDVAFILENHNAQRTYIDIFKPSVIVHGNDWKGDSLYKQMNITETQIEKYGISFVYPDYTPGISSTILREQLK